MKTLKRLFCALLALATLSATAALSVDSAGNGQVTVCAVQSLTPGTEFNPDSAPEISSARPGEIVVLTIGFRNPSAVNINGFAFKLFYDAAKVTPYVGAEPFDYDPYEVSPALVDRPHRWSSAGNATETFVAVSGGGSTTCTVASASTLVLARVAFRVNVDASGAAAFSFDTDPAKTSITTSDRKTLTLDAPAFRLDISGTPVDPVDPVDPTDPVDPVDPIDLVDGDMKVTVCAVQSLTPGTEFNPDSAPEISSARPGEIVVLTVGFRNPSAVDISGFAFKLFYDAAKVTPYVGTEPFDYDPYEVSPTLVSRPYRWSSAGNVNTEENFVAVSLGGSTVYTVTPGSTLVLARMAFRVNADASGAAEFSFDPDPLKTSITTSDRKAFAPDAPAYSLNISEYSIVSVDSGGVTLTNPAPATLYVARFDDAGKFLAADVLPVPANAGKVPVTLSGAYKVSVVLLDSQCRPLCMYG